MDERGRRVTPRHLAKGRGALPRVWLFQPLEQADSGASGTAFDLIGRPFALILVFCAHYPLNRSSRRQEAPSKIQEIKFEPPDVGCYEVRRVGWQDTPAQP